MEETTSPPAADATAMNQSNSSPTASTSSTEIRHPPNRLCHGHQRNYTQLQENLKRKAAKYGIPTPPHTPILSAPPPIINPSTVPQPILQPDTQTQTLPPQPPASSSYNLQARLRARHTTTIPTTLSPGPNPSPPHITQYGLHHPYAVLPLREGLWI